jgi:hypothetical protein
VLPDWKKFGNSVFLGVGRVIWFQNSPIIGAQNLKKSPKIYIMRPKFWQRFAQIFMFFSKRISVAKIVVVFFTQLALLL